MVPPASCRVSRVRHYSGYTATDLHFAYATITLCGAAFQPAFAMQTLSYQCPQPRRQVFGLGSSPFARRYLGNRGFFLFLRVLRCFSSPGYLYLPYFIQAGIRMHYHTWVAPFGNLRVEAYLQLTAAYRSLSRPSSAPSAKAFALCSYSLDQK